MSAKNQKTFSLLLVVFFVVNVLQAHFTELIFDEAYYWYYSQDMAWGYFDHPPMVALLIKLGSLFFDAELGVRFVSVLLATLTLPVLWDLVDDARKEGHIPAFFVLVLSMTLLNAYGFMTLPDTPLLFFTACFLWAYKRFLKAPGAGIALLLGLVMAALMYSKYHAVLVIVFVLLSNVGLLTNKWAWMAVLVALTAYLPHFHWLYENDFVSINYHLYERPNDAYNFEKYTLGFLVNLIALFGLTFPLVYRALWGSRQKDLFTKALRYLTYGVILFFFVSSFNRRVQTQWLIVICIPLVVLVYRHMLQHPNFLRWMLRLGWINIAIICYLRLGLVHQPLLFNFYYESHGNKDWVAQLRKQVGDLPVVFENSYRRAPMYAFYSGGAATFSLNNLRYRKNQYSLDDSEERVRGQKVAYVSKYLKDGPISYTKTDGTTFKGRYIDQFQSYRKLRADLVGPQERATLGDTVTIAVHNPYPFPVPLDRLRFAVAHLNDYKKTQDIVPVALLPRQNGLTELPGRGTAQFSMVLPPSNKDHIPYFRVAISENELYYGLNSRPIPLN
ncbi:glycosyltransferase family 39 protein [Maribacter sp. 2307ULW6-5]|uniref:glycosyltransferase family 39 protein n=1 Tax=Maribacter sp. 2307ULW6-5 TaxID=3386275 RepID=UPI0039BC8773